MNKVNIFERHPKKTLFILVAIILLILFFTDIAGNYFIAKHKYNPEKKYRIMSSIYHHDLAKNISNITTRWGGRIYKVSTNSLGFKCSHTAEIDIKSKKYRIVFIGDSFTEGIGVEYKNTFVGKIDSALRNLNIEVLNAGVSSYSPIIYYRKIKYLIDNGFAFNELVVFIDISDIEDEAIYYQMSKENNVISKEISGYQKLTRVIKRYSSLVRLLTNQKGKNAFAVNKKRSLWTIDKTIWKEYGITGLKYCSNYMEKLHNLLQLNNIKMTIAVYPWPDQIINNDIDSIQVKFWKSWAENKKINFINYFPCFIDSEAQRKYSYKILNKFFIKGDVHWNESGHDLVSNEFIYFYNKKRGKCAEFVSLSSINLK